MTKTSQQEPGNSHQISFEVLQNMFGGPRLEALCRRLGISTEGEMPLNLWTIIGMHLASDTEEFAGPKPKRRRGATIKKGTSLETDYQRAVAVRKWVHADKKSRGIAEFSMVHGDASRAIKALMGVHPLFGGTDEGNLASSVSRGTTRIRNLMAKARRENPELYDERGMFKPPQYDAPQTSVETSSQPTPLRPRGILAEYLSMNDDGA